MPRIFGTITPEEHLELDHLLHLRDHTLETARMADQAYHARWDAALARLGVNLTEYDGMSVRLSEDGTVLEDSRPVLSSAATTTE